MTGTPVPPAPECVASMATFDALCRYDERYRKLLQSIGLDYENCGRMLDEIRTTLFDRQDVINHQIAWLRSVMPEPVERRRGLTAPRYRGKL